MSIARAYAEAVQSAGRMILFRDLYELGFDPCLKREEIPRPEGFSPGADIESERALLRDVDVFAFIYPVWFNAPPAILSGYLQRVFGMGFGYGPIHHGGNEPLLNGRKVISFSTSGAPKGWFEQEGGWQALQNLFDKHFAAVCGLSVLGHHHLGAIHARMQADAAENILQATKRAALAACQ